MSHLRHDGSPGALRCLVVWLGASTALAALAATAVPQALTLADERTFDRVLVAGCAAASLPVAGWLWVLTTLVVLEALGTRCRPSRGVPAVVRRVVLLACGAALVGVGGVAQAATGGEVAGHDDHARTGGTSLAGLPLPDRTTGPATLTWLARATSPREVVVRAGDTLWSIAAADLPPGADDATVVAHWHRIYRLNRDLIGPDPDLIRPHQHLLLPPVTR